MNILLYVLPSIVGIIWTFPLILGMLFDLQLFKVTTNSTITLICSRITKRSTMMSEGHMRGWIWGKYYIGFVSGEDKNVVLYIYMKKSSYEKLVQQEDIPIDESICVDLWERVGNYFFFRYNSRTINMDNIVDYEPSESQNNIIDSIIEYYEKNNVCVAFISGSSGSGKSSIAYILAKKMKTQICNQFNPSDPGDNIITLYNTVSTSKDKPLIIMLDEVDTIINAIHYKTIKRHKDIPIEVYDKRTFNTFLDNIERKLYPNIIIIMTSNVSCESIDQLDPSFLRKGRVNVKAVL